jgi:predicted metal-dependent hydrolase
VPRPRPAAVRFDTPVPRHWFGGSLWTTHVINGVNLLFPAGERFFIRSVAHYAPQIRDPDLAQAVRGFIGQEAQHALAHERFFTVLAGQGYAIQPFLRRYEHLAFGLIEPRTKPHLRLATVAACEHFTALLAEEALTRPALDAAHPEVRALLRWHAAEELEHKHVAFDVLRQVDPRYWIRVTGLLLALVILGAFWAAALGTLVWQDWRQGVPRTTPDPRVRTQLLRTVFARGIVSYLRPGFHPDDRDNRHLAAAVFQREAG